MALVMRARIPFLRSSNRVIAVLIDISILNLPKNVQIVLSPKETPKGTQMFGSTNHTLFSRTKYLKRFAEILALNIDHQRVSKNDLK